MEFWVTFWVTAAGSDETQRTAGVTTRPRRSTLGHMVERRVPTREAETPLWRCTFPDCQYEVPARGQPADHDLHPGYEMTRVWEA